MSNLNALLRLELKSRFSQKGVPRKNLVLKYTFGTVFALAVYAVYCYLMYYLIQMFHVYEYDYSLLLLFTFISQIALIGFGVSSVNKNLFFSGDNELLLRFPVDSKTMFICKNTVLLIMYSVIAILLLTPFYLMFGIENNYKAYYYLMLPIVVVAHVCFSFAISNFLAIPSMMISQKFRHKHLLNLIINTVLIAGAFALYMLLINSVLSFMRDQSLSLFTEDGMRILSYLHYGYPLSCFADVLVGNNLGLSIPVCILSTALLFYIAIIATRSRFLKIIHRNVESQGASFTHKTNNKRSKPLTAVLKREIKDIFRSSTYSFQYLVMAVAAPVMVYSCNRLVETVASETLDSITSPMVTMLVMLIFVTITVSFAGSCISREGGAFYLTKISPVSPAKQVSVKVGLYLFVGTLSTVISLGVVMLAKRLAVADGFILMGNCVLFGFALTCFAVKLDMTHPRFPIGGENEVTNGNLATFVTLALGFLLSVIEGLFGLVGFVFMRPPFTYGMITLFNGVIAIASACWLFIKLQKSYNNIMER